MLHENDHDGETLCEMNVCVKSQKCLICAKFVLRQSENQQCACKYECIYIHTYMHTYKPAYMHTCTMWCTMYDVRCGVRCTMYDVLCTMYNANIYIYMLMRVYKTQAAPCNTGVNTVSSETYTSK
jgi:hypothetical protein